MARPPWEEYQQAQAAAATPAPWEEYQAAQAVAQAPPVPNVTGGRPVSHARGLGTAAGQGLSFGFLDELRGLAGAGLDVLGGLGGTQSFGDLYRTHRDIARGEEAQYAAEHPLLALGGEIAGGLAGGVASGAKAAGTAAARRLAANMAGRSLAGRLAIGAPVAAAGGATGAALGAAGQAAELEDVPGAVAAAAPLGAALGAAGGVGGELAATALQRAGGAARRAIAPPPEQRADRAIRQALERQDMTPDAAMQRIRELGAGATLADTGTATRELLDVMATQPGRTAARAGEQLAERSRLQIDELTDAIGEGRAAEAIAASKAAREAQASPLYQQAFAQGVPHTDVLEDLFQRPAIQRAWTRAKERGQDILGPSFDPNAYGTTRPSLEGWQAVKEHVDDRISKLLRTGKPKQASEIRKQILDPLLAELDAASPAYARARQIWSDSKSFDDAIDAGRAFIREPSAVATETLEGLTDAQRDAYRIGAVQAIQDRLERSGWTHDATRPFRTPAMERKLRALLGDAEFTDFMDRLEASRVKQETFGLVGRNSRTAARQAAMADSAMAQALKEFGVDVLTGQSPTVSAVSRAGQLVRNLPVGGMPEAARDIAGQALLETDPQQIALMLSRATSPLPPLVTRGAGVAPLAAAFPLGLLAAGAGQQ